MKFDCPHILLLLLLLSSCVSKDRRLATVVDKAEKMNFIISEIVQANVLTGKRNGMGTPAEQWSGFDTLNKITTDTDLIKLTDHKAAVIRCFAFTTLFERGKTDVFPLLINHLSDTAIVTTQEGCLFNQHSVAGYLFEKYFSNKNNDEKLAGMDSVLLYNGCWDTRMQSLFYTRIEPKPEYYDQLRQLSVHEGESEGIVTLAKYRKEQDVKFIYDLLKDTNTYTQEFGLRAVYNFPHPSFFPALEKMVKQELLNIKEGDYPRETLYKAIVQYKNARARKLLESVLSKSKGKLLIKYSDVVFQAVAGSDDPVYKGFKYKFS